MYFPQQPGVGNRMYSAGADAARPPFGQDWANAGWNGVPRGRNIQFDPNQPVPEPPRPNQPNNAGTMPGADSPSARRNTMTAGDQWAAWRENHPPGWRKAQRQADTEAAAAAQASTNRQVPQPPAPVGPSVPQPPAPVGPPVPIPGKVNVSSPPIGGIPGNSGRYGGINPGGTMYPPQAPVGPPVPTGPPRPGPVGPSIPGQTGKYGGINPGGGQQEPPIGAPVPGSYKKPQAGMQLSAMTPWGQDRQL